MHTSRSLWIAGPLGVVGALLASLGHAQTAPGAQPLDRLTLSATAVAEVNRDVLSMTFSATKEGTDANVVQNSLKQALDAALAEAKKIAKPGLVDVHTGNFSLYPRYANKNGQSVANGWQGTAELVVEGKDMAAISQLSGRISSMTIARVGFSLSREAREKQESDVVAQAIKGFKARAADYAKQFDYSSFRIGEVNVSTQDAAPFAMAAPQMRMKATAMADEALPVEAGKATVSVTVSGSVLLSR